ncbi:MAG: hypothetical protein IJG37_07325 [Synergistaceae bacterium]|nr:hypothetical protein [Synergistaceae bacterium]MBQ6973050.1 hypothetical protein [Synergistaceae bacterium]
MIRSVLSALKSFLKKHARFHILMAVHLKISGIIYRLRYTKDSVKHNPRKRQYSPAPYIIRRAAHNVGLFSYFNTILGGIAYADKHGYTPVVDMKNYPNTYLYPEEVGRVNAWEYYFDQPGGLPLDDALSCREYVLGRDTALHGWPDTDGLMSDAEELEHWRGLCRKYVRFTPAVTERAEAMTRKYEGMRILGVLVRGTDYVALKPKSHPIPPTAEQAIAKAREAMSEQRFDAVYLATEDKKIVAAFQEAFGEKLILPEADYLDYDFSRPDFLANVRSGRKNDKYLRGLEYLVSILFLSRCEGLITSGNNGTVAAILFSDGFEYFYLFDLGKY